MTPKLTTKFHKYLALLPTQQEPRSGFVDYRKGDSLLFSGLVGCVPGVSVDLMQAYNAKKGTWHRLPLHLGEAYERGHPRNQLSFRTRLISTIKYIYSELRKGNKLDWKYIGKRRLFKHGSTISRDMLTGVMYYAWYNKRLDISESVIRYAMANWGFMGEGDISRTNIMPSMFATFCWISHKLGGPSRAWARWIPADTNQIGLIGYAAHLQVLHILLRADITGKLSRTEKRVLTWHADTQPRNALYQAASDRFEQAAKCLEDDSIYPADRLPSKADRSEQWITHRNYNELDWLPSQDGSTASHSGADFLFDYWMLMRLFEKS